MINPMDHPFRFIATTDDLRQVLVRLTTATAVAIDTETEVIDDTLMNRGLVGAWCVLSAAARFADGSEELYVVDMTDIDTESLTEEFSRIRAYAWNANFERKVFENAGVVIAQWLDLMLFQAVLDIGVHQDYVWYTGLAAAAHQRLNVDLEGKSSIQLSYRRGVPLSEEQKAYAGQDAIVTLWLIDPISADLEHDGLYETALRECGAQRFIDRMNQVGLPFDVEGWRNHLTATQAAADQAMAHLAELTGGSEMTLFGPSGVPSWSVDSKADLVKVLNKYEPERVCAYQNTWGRRNATTLELVDTLDKTALQLIGGDIAKALLTSKGAKKLLSTYGEDMLSLLGPDQRFHSRYLQTLTATGRLSSDKPNVQNLPPASKTYTRPASEDRVFVAADYSQAELRKLAQETQDAALLEAFRSGQDLHVVTAQRMFNVDMAALEGTDEHSALRKKAKTLNFGIVYGLGGVKLAQKLTVDGVPTTPTEAKELLKRYLEVYPGVRQWLEARDGYIADLSHNPGSIDWSSTWRLYDAYALYRRSYWKLRKSGQATSSEAIARDAIGPTKSQDPAVLDDAVKEAAWALSFKAPVVLRDASTPFFFESRTSGGRRRIFNISTDEWLTSMMLIAATSNKEGPRRVRDEWAAANNVTLTTRKGRALGFSALKKAFEKKTLKADFVRTVLAAMPSAAEFLMISALGDSIRSKKNEYRNHPIQGGVGDTVLEAFALIDERLKSFDNAVGVQSVHDSIVIECNVDEAPVVREMLVDAMTEAMSHYVWDLPIKVDADITRSLDTKHDAFEMDEELLEV